MNDMFFSEVLLFLFLSLLDLLIPEAYSGFQQTSKMGNFATIRRSILDVYRSLDTLLRSSQRRCSVKKVVFRNFAKFTGKNLCQSLFFNKVAGLRYLFKNTFLQRTPPVTATGYYFTAKRRIENWHFPRHCCLNFFLLWFFS